MRSLLASAFIASSHAAATEVKASVDARNKLLAVCPEVTASCNVPTGPSASPEDLAKALDCMLKVDLKRIPPGPCYETMKSFLLDHFVPVPDDQISRQDPLQNLRGPFSLWTRDATSLLSMQRPPMNSWRQTFLPQTRQEVTDERKPQQDSRPSPKDASESREPENKQEDRDDHADRRPSWRYFDDKQRKDSWSQDSDKFREDSRDSGREESKNLMYMNREDKHKDDRENGDESSKPMPWGRDDRWDNWSREKHMPWGRQDKDNKPWDREPSKPWDRDGKNDKSSDLKHKDYKQSWDRDGEDEKHPIPWASKFEKYRKPRDDDDTPSSPWASKFYSKDDKRMPWDRDDEDQHSSPWASKFYSKPWDRPMPWDREDKHSKSWRDDEDDKQSSPWAGKFDKYAKPWDRDDKDDKRSKPWDRDDEDEERAGKFEKHSKSWDRDGKDDKPWDRKDKHSWDRKETKHWDHDEDEKRPMPWASKFEKYSKPWDRDDEEKGSSPKHWDRDDKDNKRRMPWDREDKDDKRSMPWAGKFDKYSKYWDREDENDKPWARKDKDHKDKDHKDKDHKDKDRKDKDDKHSWDRKEKKHSKHWDREDEDEKRPMAWGSKFEKNSKPWDYKGKDDKRRMPWDREDKDDKRSMPWAGKFDKYSKYWDREDEKNSKPWDYKGKDDKRRMPWNRESSKPWDHEKHFKHWSHESKYHNSMSRDPSYFDFFSRVHQGHVSPFPAGGRPNFPFFAQAPPFFSQMHSHGPAMDRRPMFGGYSGGVDQSFYPSPLMLQLMMRNPPMQQGAVFPTMMKAKSMSNSVNSGSYDYDYDYEEDVAPVASPLISLATILHSLKASRAAAAAVKPPSPRVEIAFKGPAFVPPSMSGPPPREVASSAEIAPSTSTSTNTKGSVFKDEIMYRSAP